MSKHVLPESDIDDERVVWIQPDPDPKTDPGWRLRLDKVRGELAMLFEEQGFLNGSTIRTRTESSRTRRRSG